MWDLCKKSFGAVLLIALGDYVLLKIGQPIGPFLFAFGLLGVCVLGQNLFTGKCGFLFEDKMRPLDLLMILVFNLIGGYVFGLLMSCIGDAQVLQTAADKVASWSFSWGFFIQSIFCGVIMYLCVIIYRKGSPLGIILGVPLFIFCGFQHCIANTITMGIARSFDWSVFLCIVGNFVGSLATWWMTIGVKKGSAAKKQ